MCVCPWFQRLSSLLDMSHGLRNPVVIKYYIRRVIAPGYGRINLIKLLKGSRATCFCILNIKNRKKRREHRFCKLGKRRSKEDILSFPKPQN